IALEVLLRKRDAHKLDTFAALFRTGSSKDASGLSVLRGCAIGLALLGIDTLAVWLGTTYFRGRLSMIYIGLLGGGINGAAWPVGTVLVVCFVQVIGLGLLVAFADSVASRLPIRPWVGIGGAALLLAASGIRMSMGTVQPWPFIALVLFV